MMGDRQKSKDLNTFHSRKFILALILISVSIIVILFKLNDSQFVFIFKDWCIFLVTVYAIYNGGNVGAKYVDKIKQLDSVIQDVKDSG